MSGFPRKSGSGGDGFKSPRLSRHGQAEDCQSHQNVGQGASPGKQGGQEKRAVNKGADGDAFGKRASQPDSHRDGYKLKHLSEEHMTGIKFRSHSKKKSIIFRQRACLHTWLCACVCGQPIFSSGNGHF